jgi:transposase InsO family protein
MKRKGDCCDNAPMESFFHTLNTELEASSALSDSQMKRAVPNAVPTWF